MTVTVYSKPACQQCNATYKTLEKKGLEYNSIDITKDDQAYARVKAMGFASAPVVVAGDDAWSGFRPDKIMEIANRLK